jgi:chitin disaccharide deacetylase
MLIVNADDLGRDRAATDAALACHARKRVTSTSAMVFMEDSERAADLALIAGIDVGLHINLSEPFTAANTPTRLRAPHDEIRRFLKRSKYALLLYRPGLRDAFRQVFEWQYCEFMRLYDREPSHFDGHQHLHLSSNMLFQRVIPAGTRVRRSFSFRTGEKSFVNRCYRAVVDRHLKRRHRLTDYFFSLAHHLSLDRLERVTTLARGHDVELMTHPQLTAEFEFLMSDGYATAVSHVRMAGYDALELAAGNS